MVLNPYILERKDEPEKKVKSTKELTA